MKFIFFFALQILVFERLSNYKCLSGDAIQRTEKRKKYKMSSFATPRKTVVCQFNSESVDLKYRKKRKKSSPTFSVCFLYIYMYLLVISEMNNIDFEMLKINIYLYA